MSTYYWTGIVSLLLVVIAGVIFWKYFYAKNEDIFPKKVFEKCQKDDIVSWFKEEDTLRELKSDHSLIAVVIRRPNKLAKDINENDIILAIFDENKSEIKKGIIFSCSELSNEVLTMFSDKDMVVLK